MSRLNKFTGVGIITGLILLGSATPAGAELSTGTTDAVDRVIDLSDQSMPKLVTPESAELAGTGIVGVQTVDGTIPLPAGVDIADGETIQVNYSDGLTVYESTAGCTVTASSGTPFKNYTYNTGQASFSFSVSSGCTYRDGGTGLLYGYRGGILGYKSVNKYASALPGRTVYWATSMGCKYGTTRPWYSQIATYPATATVNLPCEPA